jgi:hypothetical protein
MANTSTEATQNAVIVDNGDGTFTLADGDIISADKLKEAEAASEGEEIIVTQSRIGSECRIEREKRSESNSTRKGSSLAADIREITQTIRNETDCIALQQKIFSSLDGLKTELDDATQEIRRKLDEILPVLKLPLNPFKIPKWLKKFTLGRIFPDLNATIDLIKRTLELSSAISELLVTVSDLVPRLEACAVNTVGIVQASIQNEIDRTLEGIKRDIERAIADALCRGIKDLGISADDIQDILEGADTVTRLIASTRIIQENVNQSLGNNLARIDQNQALIQDITGIPPVLDTSSIDGFLNTADSEAYAQYQQSVTEVLESPDPVNEELPIITGVAQFGSTLTCSNGVWSANGVTNTFPLSFQWFREGIEIQGANTFQYIPGLDDVEYPLNCRVAAETQTAIEEVFTEKTAPVQFVLPTGDAPVISGSAVNGQTLSCSDGVWPFTPTTVMFEWIRVPTVGANVRVQSLSSNNLYSVKSADVGSQIKCKVVASAFRYTLSVDTALTVTVT